MAVGAVVWALERNGRRQVAARPAKGVLETPVVVEQVFVGGFTVLAFAGFVTVQVGQGSVRRVTDVIATDAREQNLGLGIPLDDADAGDVSVPIDTKVGQL